MPCLIINQYIVIAHMTVALYVPVSQRRPCPTGYLHALAGYYYWRVGACMAMKGGGAGPPATIEEGAGPPAHLPVPPDDDDVLPDIVDDDRSPLKIFDGNLARMRLPRSLPPSAPWVVEANVASTLDIDGVRVHFPNAKPFHTQVAMMTSMIGAFRASRHALIESPTGTGKRSVCTARAPCQPAPERSPCSLALLCAAIGFQIHQYEQVAAGRSEAVIPLGKRPACDGACPNLTSSPPVVSAGV